MLKNDLNGYSLDSKRRSFRAKTASCVLIEIILCECVRNESYRILDCRIYNLAPSATTGVQDYIKRGQNSKKINEKLCAGGLGWGGVGE